MNERDKNRIIAIAATVVFHTLLLLTLLFSYLFYSYPPKDDEPPIPKQDEIMFGGEYVMLGNVETPVNSDMQEAEPEVVEQSEEPKISADEPKDAGEKADAPKPVVTQKAESPMKVKEEPVKKSGPTKEELAEQAALKKQKEQSDRINKRVSFGKTNGTGSGQQGSPNGNSTTGKLSGAPGVSGLSGYTLQTWGKPSSPTAGIIKIRVRVNSRGKVTSAKYSSGSGPAAASAAVRQSCERASLNSQFSVPVNTMTEGVGTITWRFE